MEEKTTVEPKKRKKDCGFLKIGCCSFKPEDCNPEKCDMYNIEFTSRAIRKELKILKTKIKDLTKETLKLKQAKRMIKLEKIDKDDKKVKEYKQKLLLIKDWGKGMEYLDKAYRYCKRTRK